MQLDQWSSFEMDVASIHRQIVIVFIPRCWNFWKYHHYTNSGHIFKSIECLDCRMKSIELSRCRVSELLCNLMSPGPAASLAEQLKQVLAERERRLAGAAPPDAVQLTNELVDEIRLAVSEANARGLYSLRNQSALHWCYDYHLHSNVASILFDLFFLFSWFVYSFFYCL